MKVFCKYEEAWEVTEPTQSRIKKVIGQQYAWSSKLSEQYYGDHNSRLAPHNMRVRCDILILNLFY